MSLSIPFRFGWLLNKKVARVEVDISLAFHPTFCLWYSLICAESGR